MSNVLIRGSASSPVGRRADARAATCIYIYTQASPSVFRQTVTRDSVIEQRRGGEGGRGGRAYLSDKRFNEI